MNSQLETPKSLTFNCPTHGGNRTGKPLDRGALLRLDCGCEWVAIYGIGWLPADKWAAASLAEVKNPLDPVNNQAEPRGGET